MIAGDDPVRSGLVASLARPSGNVTGLTSIVDLDIIGNQLQMLTELVPNVIQWELCQRASVDGEGIDEGVLEDQVGIDRLLVLQAHRGLVEHRQLVGDVIGREVGGVTDYISISWPDNYLVNVSDVAVTAGGVLPAIALFSSLAGGI